MISARVLSLALLCSLISATGVVAAELPIPPLPENVVLQSDVEYGKAGERSLKLDLFLPKQPHETPLPVIVFIHGGGWATARQERRPAARAALCGLGQLHRREHRIPAHRRGPVAGPTSRLQGGHPLAEGQRQEVQHRPTADRRVGRFGRRATGQYAGHHRRPEGTGRRLRIARRVDPRGLRGRFLRPHRHAHPAGPRAISSTCSASRWKRCRRWPRPPRRSPTSRRAARRF